jgi:site-specific DNA-methyltransferase (adenine-specific)
VQAGGFVWRAVAVWDKTEACRPQPNGFRNQVEFILYATKGSILALDPPVYLPGALRCPAPRQRSHLTEKPVELLVQLLRLCPAGGVVCDPFAGSGTTGAAALAAGLGFLGCEWSDEYHAMAAARLAE